MGSSYYTCLLQLVHQTAGTIVADGKLSLNQAGGTTLLADYQTGSILEHRVQVLHVHIAALATFAIVCVGFRQLECRQVALLLADELVDALHLWCVDKGTLYTYRLAAVQIEHVASTYQLLCARSWP